LAELPVAENDAVALERIYTGLKVGALRRVDTDMMADMAAIRSR
jgi:hypothetical protein